MYHITFNCKAPCCCFFLQIFPCIHVSLGITNPPLFGRVGSASPWKNLIWSPLCAITFFPTLSKVSDRQVNKDHAANQKLCFVVLVLSLPPWVPDSHSTPPSILSALMEKPQDSCTAPFWAVGNWVEKATFFWERVEASTQIHWGVRDGAWNGVVLASTSMLDFFYAVSSLPIEFWYPW